MKSKKGDWIVKLKCKTEREVYCNGCTEDQAGSDPYAYSVGEVETNLIDWEVISVKPND